MHRVWAISAEEMTVAMAQERQATLASIVAIKGRTTALGGMSTATRNASHRMANLSFQLQDLGVSLAGGMNPFVLMAQQGSHPPGTSDFIGWAAGLAARPDLAPALGFDDCLVWALRLAADPEGPVAAAAEPALCRMADGLANRASVLRLLGNGVHPLEAAHAWRSLAAVHGLGPVDMAAVGQCPEPGTDGIP